MPQDFNKLIKACDCLELCIPFPKIMDAYYTTALVEDLSENSQLSNAVRNNRYRRSAANKNNFPQLAYNKTTYLKQVRAEINAVVARSIVRIGYYRADSVNKKTIDDLNAAANYLENNDIIINVRAFVTAAVVTGYAWNRHVQSLSSMRPINDYDIARFFLQLLLCKNLLYLLTE